MSQPTGLFQLAYIAVLSVAITGTVQAADNSQHNNSQHKVVRLATTTSTENSGLLAKLLPRFEKSRGFDVHVIAVGTGKALRMGRDGDVDVLLVHAPDAEIKFVDNNYGVNRRQVMYNDFVIVGPASDPAGVNGLADAGEALQKIARQKAVFVSRGDDSGTNRKELSLWKSAGITPEGPWYREAGQGMGKVLQISAEMDAYTLTDRGTWLAMNNKLPLKVHVAGDKRLYNPYGIIAVNPERYPHTNYDGAMSLIFWITSIDGQSRINKYRVSNEQLFIPMAIKQSAVSSPR